MQYLFFKSKAEYHFKFSSIKFNKVIPDQVFSLKLPKGIMTTTWDFHQKGISSKAVKERSGLNIPSIPDESFGLKLAKTLPKYFFHQAYELFSLTLLISLCKYQEPLSGQIDHASNLNPK